MLSRIIDKIQGKPSFKRSKAWKHVRRSHLRDNPICACCGGTKRLQVHHIVPVHIDPSLELRRDNLITLCRAKKYGIDCHLFVGHMGDFKRVNTTPVSLIDLIKMCGFRR